MGSRNWVRTAVFVLLTGDGFAQQVESEQPTPDLLEFLGSWEQPADSTTSEFIEMLDVWDSLVPGAAEDDE